MLKRQSVHNNMYNVIKSLNRKYDISKIFAINILHRNGYGNNNTEVITYTKLKFELTGYSCKCYGYDCLMLKS